MNRQQNCLLAALSNINRSANLTRLGGNTQYRAEITVERTRGKIDVSSGAPRIQGGQQHAAFQNEVVCKGGMP